MTRAREAAKSILSAFMATVLMVGLMPTVAYAGDSRLEAGMVSALPEFDAAEAKTELASTLEGLGTDKSPYLVSSAADLATMADMVASDASGTGARSAYYRLTADIAAGNIEPIGASWSTPFIGHFDGASHSIDYTMSTYDTDSAKERDYVGLFGTTGQTGELISDAPMAASISNLIVKGRISYDENTKKGGKDGVGGIVGSAGYTDFKNCLSYVSIGSDNSALSSQAANPVGGIAGYAMKCSLDGCANLGDVYSKTRYAGGLVGETASTTIVNSYNCGSVKGRYAGGLVGWWNFSYTANQASKLENCYVSGAVSASYKQGGALVGGLSNDTSYAEQNLIARTYASDACGVDALFGSDTMSRAGGMSVADTVGILPDSDMRAPSFLGLLSDSYERGSGYPNLKWEPGEGLPLIETQPQGALYELNATASALVVGAALPAAGKTGWGGTLSYQWYESESADGEGATVGEDSMRYTPPTGVPGTRYYWCVVTNEFDGGKAQVRSESARIQVKSLEQPASLTVTSDDAAIVISQVASDDKAAVHASVSPWAGKGVGDLSYVWQVAAIPQADEAAYVDVEGSAGVVREGKAEFTAPRESAGTRYYRCVVTNDYRGVEYVTASEPVAVTVTAPVISTAEELADFATFVNDGGSTAGLIVSVDADITALGHVPIGTPEHPFCGTLDGGGHTITLSIDEPSRDYQALIGYASDATIRNLIVGGNVVGSHYVAGVVAFATGTKVGEWNVQSGTTIENVGNEATVLSRGASDKRDYLASWGTGGVAGALDHASSLEYCFNRGAVTASGNVGGVVGFAHGANAAKCNLTALYNTGTVTVTGSEPVGGIVGHFHNSVNQSGYTQGDLALCYNAGEIHLPEDYSVSSWYGAICGYGSSSQPQYSAGKANHYVEGMIFLGSEAAVDRGSDASNDAKVNLKTTADSLASEDGFAQLNPSGNAVYKLDEVLQNGGFPLLIWEALKDVPRCTYTVTVVPDSAKLALADSLGRAVYGSESREDGKLVVAFTLIAGTYAYTVTPQDQRDYLPAAGEISVAPSEQDTVASLEIELIGDKQSAIATVSAGRPGEGSAPLEGATFTAVNQLTRESYAATADVEGNVELEGLLPGSYSYTVDAARHNQVVGTFDTVAGGESAHVAVQLVPCPHVGFEVSTTVVDDDGVLSTVAVDDATVTIVGREGVVSAGAEVALDEGAYYPPDGTYGFQVDAIGYERVTGTLTVSGGVVKAASVGDDGVEIGNGTFCSIAIMLEPLSVWDGEALQEPRQDAQGVYLISNAAELAWFASEVNDIGNCDENGIAHKDARLIADIALNDGALSNRWVPIATPVTSAGPVYAGHFDGDGHMISGLFSVGSSYLGLFGCAYSGAVIENVMVSGLVTGTNYVGGIVGYAEGSVTVRNCGNWTTVRGATDVGGIVGGHVRFTPTLQVERCFNKGTVSASVADSSTGASASAGGVLGDGYHAVVTACYNLGGVSSNGYGTGGIVGGAWTGITEVIGCYNAGVIESRFSADYDYYATGFGAIVGIYSTGAATSYGAGNFWLTGSAERGVGYNGNMPVNDASSAVSGALGLAFKLNDVLEAPSFGDPIDHSFNGGWPVLAWESEMIDPGSFEAEEDGSAEHPWKIESYSDLLEFAEDVNGGRTFAGEHLVLLSDIDLDAGSVDDERLFSGIGYGEGALSSSAAPFSGTLDGRGHTVRGIVAKPLKGNDSSGFIRNLYGGTVRHLRLEGLSSGSGASFTGGLAGYAAGATVSDCDVRMDVGANTGASGSVGGIVGRALRVTMSGCYFAGRLSGGYVPYALAGGTKGFSAFVANYYCASGDDGATYSAFAGGDVMGEGERVSADLAGDAVADLAWKLNTLAGNRYNAGIWSDGVPASSGEAAAAGDLCFANSGNDDGGARAVYRISKDTTGTKAVLERVYAHDGDPVSYEHLTAKPGFELVSGAVVTKIAREEVYGDVLADATKASSGSFKMPASDVRFSAEAVFDAAYRFTVVEPEVTGLDVGEKAPLVTVSPLQGVAGTTLTVSVSDVPAGKRVLSCRAFEADADAAAVAVQVVSIGSRYQLEMPRADVRIVVALGSRSADEWWPSDDIDFTLKHTYSSSPYTDNGNYQYSFVSVDGNEASGISSIGDDRFASTFLLSLSMVEDSTKHQYRSAYSLYDGSLRVSHDYQGLHVYDYLVNCGMSQNLPDETPVTFANKRGEEVELTIADLRSREYCSYEWSQIAEDYAVVAEGQPVILAYAEDGRSLAMDAALAEDGSIAGYEQDTPFMLVMGQGDPADKNASRMISGVDSIIVGDAPAGEVVYGDHHVTEPYSSYAEKDFSYSVSAKDYKVMEGSFTVSELEEYAAQTPAAREVRYAAGTQISRGGTINNLVGEADVYEGVSLARLIEDAGLLDGIDANGASVTFYSDDGYGDYASKAVLTVPLEYLMGGSSGDFSGNAMNAVDSDAGTEMSIVGARPYIGFAKNGFALVPYGSSFGYVDGMYNRFGPLCAVLPYNAAYGVQGDASVANNSVFVMYLSGMSIQGGQTDLSQAKVTLTSTGYVYDGKAKKPAVKSVKLGGVVLDADSYSVSYTNNVDAGTATVKVMGQGAYCGMAQTTFAIARAQIPKPAVTDRTYNGKAHTGIASAVGYSLTGTVKATNAGTYSVTAKPAANYAWKGGSTAAVKLSWLIKPAQVTSISLASSSHVYNGKAKAPVVKAVKAGVLTVPVGSFRTTCLRGGKSTKDFKNAGSVSVRISCSGNFTGSKSAAYVIGKAAGKLIVKPVKTTQAVAYGKKTALSAAKVFKVKKNLSQGKVSFKKVSGNGKIAVSSAGKVTVSKGLPRGAYKVKVKATSKATNNYKAATASVALTVKVK